jgi:hypothetical protein
MIDHEDKTLISLTEASHLIPGRPSLSTLWRWCRTGVGHPRVKLEILKIGGRIFTSKKALQTFIERLSQCHLNDNHNSCDKIELAEKRLAKQWNQK